MRWIRIDHGRVPEGAKPGDVAATAGGLDNRGESFTPD
jgi:hypothetical protein